MTKSNLRKGGRERGGKEGGEGRQGRKEKEKRGRERGRKGSFILAHSLRVEPLWQEGKKVVHIVTAARKQR